MEDKEFESGIYGSEQGDIFVLFGGKIGVGGGYHKQTRTHTLLFQELDNKYEVGTEKPELYKKEKPSVFLLFNKEEEVDVVIKALNVVKEKLKK